MPRGGKRAGAGRPRKSLEHHLRVGSYREDRHGPLPREDRPAEAELSWHRRLALVGMTHDRFSGRQLYLARWFPHSDDPAAVEWHAWNERYGMRWRLQNRCPSYPHDESAIEAEEAERLGLDLRDRSIDWYGLFVKRVDEAAANYDASVPDPPGWQAVTTTQRHTRARY